MDARKRGRGAIERKSIDIDDFVDGAFANVKESIEIAAKQAEQNKLRLFTKQLDCLQEVATLMNPDFPQRKEAFETLYSLTVEIGKLVGVVVMSKVPKVK
jgi:hypothetical protein